MIVDGTKIASEIRHGVERRISHLGLKRPLSMAVFVTREDAVTHKYITLKKHIAESIGIHVEIKQFDHDINTETFLREVLHVTREVDGIVIQLPLSPHIDLDSTRQLIPITHDIDVFGHMAYVHFEEKRLPILPPVVGAISEILHRSEIHIAGKKVVVVGEGRLVGAPAAVWAGHLGAYVQTINRETPNIAELTREAEVLILGAGSPGLIMPDMISDGVIILDAGTSEAAGKLAGDADPSCAEKASIFTPVPGGIGPIAIAKLFDNLVTLVEKRRGHDDLTFL